MPELIQANTFSAFLPVEPIGKQRVRVTKQGRAYTPAKTVENANMIKAFLKRLKAPMLEGPLDLRVTAHFIKPKSVKKRVYHSVKPDASNILKQFEDAAEGILYKNDSAIVRSQCHKIYAEIQGLAIELKSMEDALKRKISLEGGCVDCGDSMRILVEIVDKDLPMSKIDALDWVCDECETNKQIGVNCG